MIGFIWQVLWLSIYDMSVCSYIHSHNLFVKFISMRFAILLLVLLLELAMSWPRIRRIRPPAIKDIIRCKPKDR